MHTESYHGTGSTLDAVMAGSKPHGGLAGSGGRAIAKPQTLEARGLSRVAHSNTMARSQAGCLLSVTTDHPLKTPASTLADTVAIAMASHVQAISHNKDRKAFEQLHIYYAPRLKAWCLRQRMASEIAEELVQETMISVWRKAASFDSAKAGVSTWIFTILRNKRIDLLRKTNRPAFKAEDFELLQEPERIADDLMSDAGDASEIRRSIELLSADQRTMLMKAFFEEKSHSDIAAETGLPLGTVKSRIRLALSHLKVMIGPRL